MNRNAENGMGPRRVGVHEGGADGPVLPSVFHQLLTVLDGLDSVLAQLGHINTLVRALFEVQFALIVGAEQISNLFICKCPINRYQTL